MNKDGTLNGNRKLPSYEELMDLLYKKRLSYKDVALKYGVHFSAVSSTLKRDRERLGLPWPILRSDERGSRISKNLDGIMVDATVIRELLREAFDERQNSFIPESVLIDARSVNSHEHRDRRRYHVPGCHLVAKMNQDVVIPIERELAVSNRYRPCGTCCKLTAAEWVKELRLDVSAAHMYRLLSHTDDPNVRRIRKTTAVKLLQAIGEEPHEVLAGWRSKKLNFVAKNPRRGNDLVAA